MIDTSPDGSLAEHLGGLLEGCGGDETVGPEGGPGDTLKHELRGRRIGLTDSHHLPALPFERGVLIPHVTGVDDVALHVLLGISGIDDIELSEYAVVGIHEIPLVHQFFLQELSVTRVGDLNLAHHLAHDDLKVLVVDLHTLQTVNRLYLVDNIVLSLDWSEDVEDVGRGDASVREPCSGLDVVVLLNQNLLCKRNEIVLLDSGLVLDDDLTVTSLDLAHEHLTVDFGKDRRR